MQKFFFLLEVQKKRILKMAMLINCYVARLYLNYAC
jgi:hypothetical protein